MNKNDELQADNEIPHFFLSIIEEAVNSLDGQYDKIKNIVLSAEIITCHNKQRNAMRAILDKNIKPNFASLEGEKDLINDLNKLNKAMNDFIRCRNKIREKLPEIFINPQESFELKDDKEVYKICSCRSNPRRLILKISQYYGENIRLLFNDFYEKYSKRNLMSPEANTVYEKINKISEDAKKSVENYLGFF